MLLFYFQIIFCYSDIQESIKLDLKIVVFSSIYNEAVITLRKLKFHPHALWRYSCLLNVEVSFIFGVSRYRNVSTSSKNRPYAAASLTSTSIPDSLSIFHLCIFYQIIHYIYQYYPNQPSLSKLRY